MNKDFIVFDNFLSNEEIKNISERIYKFKYNLSYPSFEDPLNNEVFGVKHAKNIISFVTIDDKENNFENLPTHEISNHIIGKIFNKNFKIIRSRINITFPNQSELTNWPHVDNINENVYALIYYVNDSDGDTILYDKVFKDNINKLDQILKISPKAGSALLFKASRFHSFFNPKKNQYRCALNINFEAENLL